MEVVVLLRCRDALCGRVLEVRCGAGRILGYVLALGGEVHGIDISPAMVDHCRGAYPTADVRLGNLRELEHAVRGRYDAILAGDNVLDVLADGDRRRVLADDEGSTVVPGTAGSSSCLHYVCRPVSDG